MTDLISTKKSHIIGLVNRGHILGMEDAVLLKSEYYSTGAICLSLHADLFKIERDIFLKLMISQ